MALELTVTAKGQVTLRCAVLDHLGVVPGARVTFSFLENERSSWSPPRSATT